ncbi:MAG TPA: SDR family NAD(P)-dependent oxidoreductase, partial [Flavisolibacter sp.]|nr:SDR family NAD(P)-dependent oxidoreductase [Flavisolibacter sp.]
MAQNNNQYALITGGSEGIGYELAKLFAQDGYNLVLVARTEEKLQQTANELAQQYGISAIPIAKDLFVPKAAFELYDEVKAKGITINVLVNDAGQGQFGLFVESDIHRQLDIIQLNISSL